VRKIYEKLLAAIRHFLKQRDDLLLLVPCADSDVALLMKAMRDVDRESSSDLFLLFADDFLAPDEFLDDIARRLKDEHRLTNDAIGPDVPKLPPLPGDLLRPERAAAVRLEAGLRYAHSLIDPRRGQHFLWGMGPLQIADPQSYLTFLAHLLPRPDVRPWMRGARIVARVPADFELTASPLARAQRVQVRPFTIPPNVYEEELLETAGDPNAPVGDKMQAEVQLAYLDCAHSRFDQAIERFLKALAFYQWAEIPVMEGLVICGLGDVARRQEDRAQAEYWYTCAVVPAAKDGNPVLLSTIVHNLALVAYREQRFDDAEQRYSELVTLKRSMIDQVGLVEALEWQGLSQEGQLAYDRAIVSWHEAGLICKAFEMGERLDPLLAHLKRGYEMLGTLDEVEFDAEWRS
jgi:tetratricopeptide (TPR) repeat protein